MSKGKCFDVMLCLTKLDLSKPTFQSWIDVISNVVDQIKQNLW